MSSPTLIFSLYFPSHRGEFPQVESSGTNANELATDDTVVGTARTRRASEIAGAKVGAGTETWLWRPVL